MCYVCVFVCARVCVCASARAPACAMCARVRPRVCTRGGLRWLEAEGYGGPRVRVCYVCACAPACLCASACVRVFVLTLCVVHMPRASFVEGSDRVQPHQGLWADMCVGGPHVRSRPTGGCSCPSLRPDRGGGVVRGRGSAEFRRWNCVHHQPRNRHAPSSHCGGRAVLCSPSGRPCEACAGSGRR